MFLGTKGRIKLQEKVWGVSRYECQSENECSMKTRRQYIALIIVLDMLTENGKLGIYFNNNLDTSHILGIHLRYICILCPIRNPHFCAYLIKMHPFCYISQTNSRVLRRIVR